MNLAATRTRVNKAVILAGGQSTRLNPLNKDLPGCMLPLFNRPMIDYSINFLKSWDIREVIIAASKDSGITGYVKDLNKAGASVIEVRYMEDERPRGTAGILRDLKGFLLEESFLVLNANTFMNEVNLDEFLSFHFSRGSHVTMGVERADRSGAEGINATKEGAIDSISIIHSSRDRRSSLKPLGIYAIKPEALAFIDEKGYFDIKEQLIPALKNASLPTYIHQMNGYCRTVNSLEDYYGVQMDALSEGYAATDGLNDIGDSIWAGSDVAISSGAYILGPVIIGKGSVINDGAQIIGPAVIGEGCEIGEGSLVRESILWDGVNVEKKSKVSYSIVGSRTNVKSGTSHRNNVLVNKLDIGDLNVSSRCEFNRFSVAAGRMDRLKYGLFAFFKRIMDMAIALAALAMFLPLMVLISGAVKLDSTGPVIFKQKRCGRGGKDFNMLKFRTMVVNADNMQKQFMSKKDVDGPVFKLTRDPRITRIGEFLRRTSLDELPQLINVLMGEMSLVGPRPLVMSEMKFSPSWRDIRLKVRPGITGLWQVQGRSSSPFHNWIHYDIQYVRSQSFWMDLKILFKTIPAVFKKTGAR